MLKISIDDDKVSDMEQKLKPIPPKKVAKDMFTGKYDILLEYKINIQNKILDLHSIKDPWKDSKRMSELVSEILGLYESLPEDIKEDVEVYKSKIIEAINEYNKFVREYNKAFSPKNVLKGIFNIFKGPKAVRKTLEGYKTDAPERLRETIENIKMYLKNTLKVIEDKYKIKDIDIELEDLEAPERIRKMRYNPKE